MGQIADCTGFNIGDGQSMGQIAVSSTLTTLVLVSGNVSQGSNRGLQHSYYTGFSVADGQSNGSNRGLQHPYYTGFSVGDGQSKGQLAVS